MHWIRRRIGEDASGCGNSDDIAMLFGVTRQLARSVAGLNQALARDVPVQAVIDLAREHPAPRRMARILASVLEFERDPRGYNAGHPQRQQQRLNHAADFRASQLVSKALALFFDFCRLEDAVGCAPELVAEQGRCLAAEGYALLPQHLPEATVERIVRFLANPEIEFREHPGGKVHRGYRPECVASTTANVCRAVDQSALLASPDIAELAFDPNFIAIAQAFLGAPPVHTQVNAWWSVPHSDTREHASAAAQKFHQDRDYIKFLKIFIYLTDVGEANGPHQFIAGSNADYAEMAGQPYRASKRREDADLLAIYGPGRLRVFTAPRGSVLLEDTSGFHKGTSVASGHRMMLQLEYVSSLFASPRLALTEKALEHVDANVRARCTRIVSAYGLF